jgi:membrane associated rhomboid family serine protease
VVAAVAICCAVVWLMLLATQEKKAIEDTALGQWMVLRVGHFDLRNLLTYHFLHESWIHLILNVGILVYAGRMLELRWGSLKFSFFYMGAALAGGLSVYGLGYLLARSSEAALQGSISFGASGVALACLAAYTVVMDDRPVIAFFTERYLIWSGMILYGAFLVLLEHVEGPRGGSPLFLTPHLSGIAAGAALAAGILLFEKSSRRAGLQASLVSEQRLLEIHLRVDQILEKITRSGMNSLSQEEQSFLHDASRHFRSQRH